MRRDMRFHQQFFCCSCLLGCVVGFKPPNIILEGVCLRRRVSVALSVFTTLRLLLNIVINWWEQFLTWPCLQSFHYIRVKPAEKTHGSSLKCLYHFPQLANLGIQFITNLKWNVCTSVTRYNTTAYNIIKSHLRDTIACELNVFLIFQSVFFRLK
jgi:hypothetical protein